MFQVLLLFFLNYYLITKPKVGQRVYLITMFYCFCFEWWLFYSSRDTRDLFNYSMVSISWLLDE